MPINLTAVVARARELYAQGHKRPEVFRAIFGADFPPEFFVVMGVLDEDVNALPVDVMCRPYEVYCVGEPGHEPYFGDEWTQRQEAAAAEQHPNVVLLMHLSQYDAEHGDYIVGYDIEELRVGRSTLVGFYEEIPAQGASPVVLGPSLLHVLHEWAADHLRMMRFQATIWESIRYDMLGDAVERAADLVHRIEEMRRQADALPWRPMGSV